MCRQSYIAHASNVIIFQYVSGSSGYISEKLLKLLKSDDKWDASTVIVLFYLQQRTWISS